MKRQIRGFIQEKRVPLLFVGAFAVIATTLLIATRAAGPSYFLESENGTLSGNATLSPVNGTDATMSGGKGVRFNAPAVGGSTFIAAAGDIAGTWTGDTSTANKIKADASLQAILALGDLAYPNGTEAEFQNYDSTWGAFKAKTYPAIGNHEYFSSADNYKNYWTNSISTWASTPLAPAVVRANPIRYSFNIGGWHIISLDSEQDIPGQTTWLQQDLAANPVACTIAFWHSPFLAGSSSTGGTSTGRVKPFWQALYNAKADLVLGGHEHAYVSFNKADTNGTTVASGARGIRSFVVGTGGTGLANEWVNKAARLYLSKLGYLKLELKPTSYTWQFIDTNGAVADSGSDTCDV